mgnify:CR=1 FL=1
MKGAIDFVQDVTVSVCVIEKQGKSDPRLYLWLTPSVQVIQGNDDYSSDKPFPFDLWHQVKHATIGQTPDTSRVTFSLLSYIKTLLIKNDVFMEVRERQANAFAICIDSDDLGRVVDFWMICINVPDCEGSNDTRLREHILDAYVSAASSRKADLEAAKRIVH